MATQMATQRRLNWTQLDRSTIRLLDSTLCAAIFLSFLVAALLLARRMLGQIDRPLTSIELFSMALVTVTATSAIRFAWRRLCAPRFSWESIWSVLWIAPSITLILLGTAVSIPGTTTFALAVLWTVLLGAESLWWFAAWRLQWITPQPQLARADDVVESGSASALEPTVATEETADDPESSLLEGDEEEEELLAQGITQQLTRSNADSGAETIAGLLRQQFDRGERSRSLHVAFCPPLYHRPTVDVVQISGPESRIKTGEIHPYGVRFDLRLTATCEQAEDVLIHFEAREQETK